MPELDVLDEVDVLLDEVVVLLLVVRLLVALEEVEERVLALLAALDEVDVPALLRVDLKVVLGDLGAPLTVGDFDVTRCAVAPAPASCLVTCAFGRVLLPLDIAVASTSKYGIVVVPTITFT
mmetsp:Transcript_148/g.463  ORF Transcript_148/g.463 Transcript_148/m.463 type:complete len:122 (+) Transcript_148:1417-1782(+)